MPSDARRQTEPGLTDVMQRNIAALLALREEHQRRTPLEQRLAAGVARRAGSVASVYLHAALFGGWIIVNAGLVPGVRPVDPFPFVMLAMFASVEAIFLSTFVLISQNRAAELVESRADLDVQIDLLAEHEITHLVRQVDAIASHLGVRLDERGVEEMKRDVDPSQVVEQIRSAQQAEQKD